MQLTLLDPNVSMTMNVFLSIANIINLIYNVPQVIKTYKTKSTKDFSSWFIFLRIFGNIIWIAYAIDIDSLQMLVNNCVTVFSSMFIGYYKVLELYKIDDRLLKPDIEEVYDVYDVSDVDEVSYVDEV
jgi:MtN3 and saliva related transmembrane protein